jgi:hypothetical protein
VSTAFSKQKMADAPVPSATRPSRVPSEQDLWTQPEPDDQYADVVSASARTRSLSIGGSSLSVSIHEELDQLDHHSPRARFSRSGSELTFALTLSQSELDVAKSVALAGGPGAKTRRVLKLSVKTKPKTRSMLFCAVLWRLIPACAAAAVVFGAASRWGHSAPSLFGRSGAPASLEGGARAALLSRETARGSIESYSWGVEPEAGPLDAATTVVLQQGSAILSQARPPRAASPAGRNPRSPFPSPPFSPSARPRPRRRAPRSSTSGSSGTTRAWRPPRRRRSSSSGSSARRCTPTRPA